MRRRFYTNKKNILPLYIEAKEDGVSFSSLNGTITVRYQIDMGDWTDLKYGNRSESINKGQRLYIKSNVPFTFSITGRCKIGGDIRSVYYGDNYKIFNGGDYSRVFANCTTIEEVEPNLLKYVTDLSDYCFYSMFSNCTSLTTAPELPATTLADYCYSSMFDGCTSLVNAPALPATTLADNCYSSMFYGCSKLNYIKMLATDISAQNCLSWWVYKVASTGTFVKNPAMTSLPTGISGIPSGWTVVNDGEESGEVSVTVEFENLYPDLIYYLENKYGFDYGSIRSPIAIEEDIWIGESFEEIVGAGQVKYLFIDDSPSNNGITLYLSNYRETYYCVTLNNNRNSDYFGLAGYYMYD